MADDPTESSNLLEPQTNTHTSPVVNRHLISDSEDSESEDDLKDHDPTPTYHAASDSDGDEVPPSLIVENPLSEALNKGFSKPLGAPITAPKNPILLTRTRIVQPVQPVQPTHHGQQSNHVLFDETASHRPSRKNHLPLPVSNIPPPMRGQPRTSFGLSDVSSAFDTVCNVANSYISAASQAMSTATGSSPSRPRINLSVIDPKERALWKWSNVENLDSFLREIYDYYLGNGFYCILLSRALNMATILFVVTFSTYLTSCIDYSKISTSSRLSEIQYPQCAATRFSPFKTFLLWLFALFWFAKLIQYVHDIRRLLDLKKFYLYLLDISENEMQTISWQQVVKRLMLLRDQNPQTSNNISRKNAQFLGNASQSKKRMGPQDIANRIMRKENYMIAMINKNVLDLSIPSPFPDNVSLPFFPFDHKPFLTRTLEWNLSLCIMDFVFNSNDELRSAFLKESNRKKLSDALRRRFILASFTNIICAPITVVYMAILYFFRYFNEYHKDPSAIGTRQYTPLAEWKMREFNELHHMFQRRLQLSYDPASKYVNQFPKEKTIIFSRFVVFVCGSFAAVLGIISLIDPELFLGFEITKDRTVLFYIGLFGSILAVARGMIPDSSESFLFDPETSLKAVAEYTHFLPDEWSGRYHTDEVKNEFSEFYDLKIMIILRELVSVIVTPFILWWSLPKCSEKVVDFFREFSVHIDGLGYVCSFATFDFTLNGKRGASKRGDHVNPLMNKKVRVEDDFTESEVGDDLEDESDEIEYDNLLPRAYYSTADGKMLKSYLNFLENYGDGNSNGNNNGNSEAEMASSVVSTSQQWHASPTATTGYGYSNSVVYDRRGLPAHAPVPTGSSSFYGGSAGSHAMENSVMGKFNRIQQQRGGIRSGNTTPLTRSGILDSTGLNIGDLNSGSVIGAVSTAVQRRSLKASNAIDTRTGYQSRGISSLKNELSISSEHSDSDEEDDVTMTRDPKLFNSKVEESTYGNGSYGDSYAGSSAYAGPDDDESEADRSESEEENKTDRGVLGLLNQFYKHNDVTMY